VVSEFSRNFTGGKNSIAFNGSNFLKKGSEIFVECLDSLGNALYIELAKSSNVASVIYTYKESTSFVFSIWIFGDTYDGVGYLTLYGTLIDGRSVKWTQAILVNKSQKNASKVRFYQTPTIDVQSALVPVLSSSMTQTMTANLTFNATVEGFAVNPKKDTNLSAINKGNTDIDYRLTVINPIIDNTTPDVYAFNSQMIGSSITVNVNRIQAPLSTQEIDTIETASYTIINVLDNHTLQIDQPYYAADAYNNSTVTNIVNADVAISYSYVNYLLPPIEYQTTTINGTTYVVKGSYADITYKNIRTFSGYVARHKVYRKSLVSNADWSIIADEPIAASERLMDDITQNKYYDLLGTFYNQTHINNYWFSSTAAMTFQYGPVKAINSAVITTDGYNVLTGNDYLMVKNDSVDTNRDAIYVPYDESQFLAEYGPAYDSNFISLKANVQYIIEVSTIIVKDQNELGANLAFYFTSSVPDAQLEKNYTPQFGIALSNVTSSFIGTTYNVDNYVTFFTPQNDLYGTLVVVPTLCNPFLKNISIRVYGDDGFSPDIFETRIPWQVSAANETFQIKSELYDGNNNLIFSSFGNIQTFDPYGSSLVPYIPDSAGGGGTFTDLEVLGNLTVDLSTQLNGPTTINGPTVINNTLTLNHQTIYIPDMPPRPTEQTPLSQSRMLSVRADGAIVWDPIVDIGFDDKYLYLSLDAAADRSDTSISTKKALATEYSDIGGRKIFWSDGIKYVQSNP
jgi:hypothetical protein